LEAVNLIVIIILSCLAVGGIAIAFYFFKSWRSTLNDSLATQLKLDNITKDIESERKKVQIQASDEILKMRKDFENEQKEARSELNQLEKRIRQQDESLEKKLDILTQKEKEIERDREKLKTKQQKAEELVNERNQALLRVSGLTLEEAREQVFNFVREQNELELSRMLKAMEDEAAEKADAEARRITTIAIQRVAVEQTTENTVSVVPISNDELKGRIIGREGRNIRTFENLTGVDLIVDDTPEAVVISGFDPVRREVARLSLQALVEDGRIHPTRIEETVTRAKAEVDRQIKIAGDKAVMEASITGLHPEIIRTLGRLYYRTSYGQNVLNHSIEVCHISRMLAEELNANVEIAKRAGLLHDLGKALDSDNEGPHAELSADFVRRFNENKEVLHAISSHHGEPHPETIEAIIVQVADAISAARPGARRESLTNYIKRLEKLEEIATGRPGVERCYAIQAGREIRILVKPEEINDDQALIIARDVAKEIEKDMQYPGQIKVTVIRETRQVDYAK